MKELVLKWNNTWAYDFWWREKYNIAFNSSEHRAMSPMDIKFDYVEKKLADQQQKQMEDDEEKRKQYIQSGVWLRKNEQQTKKEEKQLEEISLGKILGKK